MPYSYVLEADLLIAFMENGFPPFGPAHRHLLFPAKQEIEHGLPKLSDLKRINDKIGEGIAVVQELGEVNQLENVT